MVLTQALNGAGDTKTPTRLNILCFCVFQIPLAYYLVKFTSLQANGAMIAIPLAHVALTALAWVVFRKGKWREVKI